jgi:dGTPase
MPNSQDALLKIRRQLEEQEEARLSPYACPSIRAIRRRPDPGAESGHRLTFALDADRILHSLAYTRYIDKTQVFSLMDNDHITHRVLHVQLVSKIGRTIGRLLGLNEDLIEAMALGHDIGHPPFGHDGETFLSRKCVQHGLGPYLHNLQSVHFLEKMEKRGQGLNLSLQVLDGVMCHDGEVHTAKLEPRPEKTFAQLDLEMIAKQADPKLPLTPMTLEGCVVRICDTVAYIGRDLEDAISVGLIRREDMPQKVREVLGETNGTIVYRLVEDLVRESAGKPFVGFSEKKARALGELKNFNLQNIYLDPRIKSQHSKIEKAFDMLFEHYLEDYQKGREESPLFRDFLVNLSPSVKKNYSPASLVRDFLAGMTDEYFLRRYQELVWPQRLPSRLD